jgi:pheromone shutdown protein TraB
MLHDDPRLTGDHVRRLQSTRETELTLVGVVHDHPASKYRTRSIINTVNPDVLALELPPLAIPLFTEYANDTRVPPTYGGEMSSAIQAVDTADVVGIDGPTVEFACSFFEKLLTEHHLKGTMRKAIHNLASVSKHAALCRLACVLARRANLTVEVDEPVSHDCSWDDDPKIQATDEHSEIRQAKTVMNVFETSEANALRKRLREDYMANELASLPEDKRVVAIVGIGHLDEVADRYHSSDSQS